MTTPLAVFILKWLTLVALSTMACRYFGLHRIAPFVVIQIIIGFLLGGSILGRGGLDIRNAIVGRPSAAAEGVLCPRLD